MSSIRRINPYGEHFSAQSVLNRLLRGTRHSNSTATGGQNSKPRPQGSSKDGR